MSEIEQNEGRSEKTVENVDFEWKNCINYGFPFCSATLAAKETHAKTNQQPYDYYDMK